MMNGIHARATKAMALGALAMATTTAGAQDVLWMSQIGTSENDGGSGVAVDNAGNTYVAGGTYGDLGNSNQGRSDTFVAKFDPSGLLLWVRQLGTHAQDFANDVAVDKAGNVYVTGITYADLAGPYAGIDDGFVLKYDTAGTLLWKRQFGSEWHDRPASIAVSKAGDVYIAGSRSINAGLHRNAFLTMYDELGTQQWMTELGGPIEVAAADVAVDSVGDAYIVGLAVGPLGGNYVGDQDVFLAKYTKSGAHLWTRQIGTPGDDAANGVALDGIGGVYVTGRTNGSLGGPNAGKYDIFISKFTTSGGNLWTSQIGGTEADKGEDIAADGDGNTYVTGSTLGQLNRPFTMTGPIFLLKCDPEGELLWTRQLDFRDLGASTGVAIDNAGDTYVTGGTRGELGTPNAGGYDIFLAKFGDTCYADCDQSTGNGVLDLFDFLCFQNSFVSGEAYACDCDTSTGPLVCDLFDFLCFQGAFVGGCP